MTIYINNQPRRFNGRSKNWCRRTPEDYINNLRAFYTSSENPKKSDRKIFMRSFKSRIICREFISNLNSRYKRRFKKPINIRINLKGTKVEYFGGGKCKK